MRAFIPNLITLLNLLMGCIATVLAAHNHLIEAGVFVGLGIFFDFFDGLVARLLHVSSELGKQLDSLADVVTSGLVPGIVMFQLLNQPDENLSILDNFSSVEWYAYLGFLITLASAYRLAKFNIDNKQSESFIGLPTPANAIFILSLAFILEYETTTWVLDLIQSKLFLIPVSILSAFALNMKMELFSLKLKSFNFTENKVVFLFLFFSIVALLLFQFLGIPIIIISYIIISIVNKKNTAKTTS